MTDMTALKGKMSLASGFWKAIKINSAIRSVCSIRLHRYPVNALDNVGQMLSGDSDNEDMKLEFGIYAKYYQTSGPCCWELFKGERFRGASTRVHSAIKPTKNNHVINSVKKVKC